MADRETLFGLASVLRDRAEKAEAALEEAIKALSPCAPGVEHDWHTDSEGVGCAECGARYPAAALTDEAGRKP